MVTPYVARLMVVVAVAPAFLVAPACQRIQTSEQSPATGTATVLPATSRLSSQEDGQWLMAAKNYANTRFSGLNEITADNVGSLKPAWTFSTGVLRGHEGAPLVVGDTL
jgi:glucose dehydrogenase